MSKLRVPGRKNGKFGSLGIKQVDAFCFTERSAVGTELTFHYNYRLPSGVAKAFTAWGGP